MSTAQSISAGQVRCGIYARISKDASGDMLGVHRQAKLCKKLAAKLGWPVDQVYIDDNISAWSGKRRPAYQRMLEDIRLGRINAVVVYDTDRLTRRPMELEEFIEVCQAAKVSNLATVSGDIDLSTSQGQMVARLLGAMAKKSSDDTSRRLKAKYEELADSGQLIQSRWMFGYEPDRRRAHPERAAVVREMAQRVLSGEPARQIALDLNRRGIKGSGGGKWDSTGVRALLLNPRLAGLQTYKGEVRGRGDWDAILDLQTHERLKALYLDPVRRLINPVRQRLLTSLVVCGRCGHRMHYAGKKHNQIRCVVGIGTGACGKTGVTASGLEAWVVESIRTVAKSLELTEGTTEDDAERTRLIEELQMLDRRKAELAELFIEVGRDGWVAATRALEARLTTARKALARLDRQTEAYPVDTADALENWDTLPLHARRALVMRCVDRIIVHPVGKDSGNRLTPDRLEVHWVR